MKRFFAYLFLLVSIFTLWGLSKEIKAQSSCDIVSAGFRPTGNIPFDEQNPPYGYLDVQTQNCGGEIIGVAIRGSENTPNVQNDDMLLRYLFISNQQNPASNNPGTLNNVPIGTNVSQGTPIYGSINITTSPYEDFSLSFLLSETSCDENGVLPDCQLRAEFTIINTGNINQIAPLESFGGPGNYQTVYDCQNGCDNSSQVFHGILNYGATNPNDPGSLVNANPAEYDENYINFLNPNADPSQTESLLAPIPFFSGNQASLGELLNSLVQVMLVIAGVGSLIMIIVGGVTYMTSDAIGNKSRGKDLITNAIIGLVLSLGAWIILNTLNPNLASNLGFNLPVLTPEGDINVPSQPVDVSSIDSLVYCPGSGGVNEIANIASSMAADGSGFGKITYRFGGKFTSNEPPYPNENPGRRCDSGLCRETCPTGQICVDCSGYTNIILQCAGIPSPGAGTSAIFSNSEDINDMQFNLQENKVYINGTALVPGDMVGRPTVGGSTGHVFMYIGSDKFTDAQGGTIGRKRGRSASIRSFARIQDKYSEYLVKVKRL